MLIITSTTQLLQPTGWTTTVRCGCWAAELIDSTPAY